MNVRTIHTLQRARQFIPTGSVIELPDAEAQALIAKGAVAAVTTVAAAPAAATSRVGDPLLERFPSLNAKDAMAAIADVVVPELLGDLRALEIAREKGARKSVLEALDAKVDALAADDDLEDDEDAGSDDGDDDKDGE